MYRTQFSGRDRLKVYHDRRVASHRVRENLAARGKIAVVRFLGFKSRLVVNDERGTARCSDRDRHVDDRQLVPHLLLYLSRKVLSLCRPRSQLLHP